LEKLRGVGFRIALDDFGTGLSNLAYLRRFQVDKIKIDSSFTDNIGRHVDSAAMVAAVVTLGHSMGLTVTAEGIETREQMDLLSAAGCNGFQGHLFSPAVSEQSLADLISSHSTGARDGVRRFELGPVSDRRAGSRQAA
jgi:EAL domain-containing protein (putative c-di-GMP-specific phosphodiesterase class I)